MFTQIKGGYNFAMKHYAGHFYHIYNRGVGKQNIFTCANNYLFLLQRIQKYLPLYPINLIAYCLMPNHYHLFLYTEKDGAPASFVQRLFNSYTQAFNRQKGRSGTLFEGRAKSKPILENEYLFHIARYIHLNPVRAGLVEKPESWAFSNYREFIGLRKSPLFDAEFLEIQFGSPEEYRLFVEDGIPLAIEKQVEKYYFD
jgi:REP element-mobilizing transposase RayT